MLKYFCKTLNGYHIYYETTESHFLDHVREAPALKQLVKEILEEQIIVQDKIRLEHDFKKIIGCSQLVETSPNDQVVYAKRPYRDSYMRFVKNRQPTSTSFVTLDLKKIDQNKYELGTAYFGQATPFLPGEPDATTDSLPFWSRHALIWNPQGIIAGTETTICPW